MISIIGNPLSFRQEFDSDSSFYDCSTSWSSGSPLCEREDCISQSSGERPKHGGNKKDVYLSKKKTELCKTYSLGLECPYGDSCSFAHGLNELRSKVHVPARYKTKKCREFYGSGYCKFGTRCQFLHLEHEKGCSPCLHRMNYTQILSILETSHALKPEGSVDTLLEQSLNLPKYNIPRLAVFENVTKRV